MSDTTRTHRPNPVSPRYTKARGIGRDRMRWPASAGTFRYRDVMPTVAELAARPLDERQALIRAALAPKGDS